MPAAFIVDGLTEKKIIQKVCEGSTVRTTGLNGKNVTLTAIAKVVHSFVRLFKDRHYPVVVVIDREGRPEPSDQIEQELTQLLVGMGVKECNIIVSCPDRMIENWMLGDFEYFDEVFDLQLSSSYEGANGKGEIRRLLRQKEISYHETSIGVEIFTQMNPSIVACNSPSFARLGARCAHFCHWIMRHQAQ
jgi:hypothetical protein